MEENTFRIKQEEIDIKEEQYDDFLVTEPIIEVIEMEYEPETTSPLLLNETNLCPFCSKQLSSSQFQCHLYEVHKFTKIFRCSRCSFASMWHDKYSQHVRSKHFESYNYSCTHCKFSTGSRADYEAHVVGEHEGFIDYQCRNCFRDFPKIRQAARHKCGTRHLRSRYMEFRGVNGQKTFKCKICNAVCKTRDEVVNHIIDGHGNLDEDSEEES